MPSQDSRLSPGLAAFGEALGLTALLFLVFSVMEGGIGLSWLVAGALVGLFLVGWGLLYVANRFGRRGGGEPPSS